MATMNGQYTVRQCAQEIMEQIARCAGDDKKLSTAVRPLMEKLIARPDLLMLGVRREGNHVTNAQWLYYDGQLGLSLDQLPYNKPIPPHDHGMWEALGVYRGKLKHTVYVRADDGTVPGHAELKVVDDRTLGYKDFVMVAPPAEIHSFTALTDDTFVITVHGGNYKPDRFYFQPESKTYFIKQPRAMRS